MEKYLCQDRSKLVHNEINIYDILEESILYKNTIKKDDRINFWLEICSKKV